MTLDDQIKQMVDERVAEHLERFQAQGLSVPEAAARLGLSTSSAWRAVRRGDIRSERVLGRVLVPQSEVERILGEG